MSTRNGSTNGSGQKGSVSKTAATSEKSTPPKVSRALEVLREGLQTIDDAADLLRAALMDMEEAVRPHSFTGHHLNGIGKFIQLKREKDRMVALSQRSKGDPLALPGNKRRIA